MCWMPSLAKDGYMPRAVANHGDNDVDTGLETSNVCMTIRRLSLGFPDMERLADDAFISDQNAGERRMGHIDRMLIYLNRLVNLDGRRRLLIVGCGPKPLAVTMLLYKGHDVVGVEPVPSFVRCAREFVGSPESIVQGTGGVPSG